MKNYDQLDQLLKQALSLSVEPSESLNEKIKSQLKEGTILTSVGKKRVSAVLIAAILTLVMSITAFAAWNLLHPKQVAEYLGDQRLARAFEDKNALQINESAVSGGYRFTLLGIVSGESLSDFKASAQDLHPNRTYAVVSIAKEDGSKMPDSQEEDYGKVPFFVSPLIKGQKPWQVNIASMNGGYSEFVLDGVMYRLIECDGVEMFADRGLYLCISTSNFYDTNAFVYHEKTGEITRNMSYEGANALFDLPLDKKKANHEKAENYLKELLNPQEDVSEIQEEAIDWEKEIARGVVIPESIKEVTYHEDGLAYYDYEDKKISISLDHYFKKEETDVYKTVGGDRTDKKGFAIQFKKDKYGAVTGRVLELNLQD